MEQAKLTGAALALLMVVAACGERDEILPGQRFDVRTPLGDTVAAEGEGAIVRLPEAESEIPPISLPAQSAQTDWTHRGGSVLHTAGHARLGATPQEVFSVKIGGKDGRKGRITASPVFAGGRAFAMGADSTVSAVSPAGAVLWSRNLTPASDRVGDATSGGLAATEDTVYVTTGFGRLHALDAATGAERWFQDLDAGATGTPAVLGNSVYVVSRDARAWSIDTKNGRINWQVPGLPARQVRAGGPGPVVSGDNVIFPFGSGELLSVLRTSGIRAWAATVSGERQGRAFAGVDDVTGDPVLVGGTLYAANPSGRIVALDAASGERLWTATEGAVSTLVVAGGSVFAVTDLNALVRLDASTGEKLWESPLPLFKRQRLRRRKGITAQYGPVLAGGRLWVAGSDGEIRGFDPQNGALTATLPIRGGAAAEPIVVNGTMYVVGRNGQLHAYR
jgi:outer membrane protein assembly factor BamB